MTFVHGKNTFISVGGNDLSAYTDSSEYEEDLDSHDVTCYGNNGHVFAGGLTDGGFKFSGTYDNTASTGPRAVLNPLLKAGALTTVIRRPEGTASTKPQDSFSFLLTKYVETSPVADMVKWSAEGKISGDVDSTPQA
jgi:hypothetical protein